MDQRGVDRDDDPTDLMEGLQEGNRVVVVVGRAGGMHHLRPAIAGGSLGLQFVVPHLFPERPRFPVGGVEDLGEVMDGDAVFFLERFQLPALVGVLERHETRPWRGPEDRQPVFQQDGAQILSGFLVPADPGQADKGAGQMAQPFAVLGHSHGIGFEIGAFRKIGLPFAKELAEIADGDLVVESFVLGTPRHDAGDFLARRPAIERGKGSLEQLVEPRVAIEHDLFELRDQLRQH